MNIKNIPNQALNHANNQNNKPNTATIEAEVRNAAIQTAQQAPKQAKATTLTTISADKVTLTATTQQAKSLDKKMEDAKVDNSEKIKSLKLAIESGDYQVDTDAVAKKLIQTELMFAPR